MTISIEDPRTDVWGIAQAPICRDGHAAVIAANLARRVRSASAEAVEIEELAWELAPRTDTTSPMLRRPAWLERARSELADRYMENVSLRSVAEGVGVHPTHLVRGFRAHFHTTPSAFVRNYRMARAAAELLSTKPRPIAEIAFDVGFADQSSFTKAFKRVMGAAPDRFRRT